MFFFNSHVRPLFSAKSIAIVSYADGLIPYVCLEDMDLIIVKLEVKASYIFQWFNENTIKTNVDKCHLLITTNEKRIISIEGEKIQISKSEKLLGVTSDNKLCFP